MQSIRPFSLRKQTAFVTFYSFKGGVGRSMALLNVASIMAGRGRRVLMIDFDLEAPGLTLLQRKERKGEIAVWQNGLVELIGEFLSTPRESPLADKENKARFRDQYTVPISIPKRLKRAENGYLDLMPCGRLDESYEQRLYEIKFDKLYEEGVGLPLFKHFKNVIKESSLYDYVLIDSRTGLSDEGNICTRDLADYLVVIMGLNRQNVEGTVRVLRQLKESGWEGSRAICVASPVPVHYEELRESRMKAARQAIRRTGLKVQFDLSIPYHPRLALDEDPLSGHWPETDLLNAYEALQSAVRELAKDTETNWAQRVIEAANNGKIDEILLGLREIELESRDTANNLLNVITGAQTANRFPNDSLKPIFDYWLEIATDKAYVHQQHAKYLRAQGNNNQAIQELKLALSIADNQQNSYRANLVHYHLGQAYSATSRFDQALQEFQRILSEVTDQQLIAVTCASIGHVHRLRDDYNLALQAYQQALPTLEEFGDKLLATEVYSLIGEAHQSLGHYNQALQFYQQALAVQDEIGHQRGAAVTRIFIGRHYEVRGYYDQALQFYQQALAVQNEIGDHSNAAATRASIGNIYQACGNYDQALQSYQQSVETFEQIGNSRNKAAVLGEIGKVQVAKGEVLNGFQNLNNALQIFKELQLKALEVETHIDYSQALLLAQNPDDAINYINEHWALIEQIAKGEIRAEAFAVRAKLKAALGDFVGSKEDAEVAVAFYRKQGVHTALAKEAEELAAAVPNEPLKDIESVH